VSTKTLMFAFLCLVLGSSIGTPVVAGPPPDIGAWTTLATGLVDPTHVVAFGEAALLIAQRHGTILVWEDGTIHGEPFLDLEERVGTMHRDQGLQSLALAPDFATSGKVYVSYTDNEGAAIVERIVTPPGTRAAGDAPAEVLLRVPKPHEWHNIGLLAFGPDGMLYIGSGDGGGHKDPWQNAQDLGSLLGKMLRIDVSGGQGYTIPPDNPFVGRSDARPEIWAYGLRNPWRFAFHPDGDLLIADVGELAREEVNLMPAGSAGTNFGWSRYEGTQTINGSRQAPGAVPPVLEIRHEGGVCSIIGGLVYRGDAFPSLRGRFIYSDFCAGQLHAVGEDPDEWVTTRLSGEPGYVSSLGEDAQGEVLRLDFVAGLLQRFDPV
jgi:glucose/arabinose dehydrogenase